MRLAAEVVMSVDGAPRPQPLLVMPVGDALQEPFWPEGLGVNRGMHNALDACWTANKWGLARSRGAGAIAELVQQRQALYESKTLQMHGKNRNMLKGYKSNNSKGTSPKPAHHYTPVRMQGSNPDGCWRGERSLLLMGRSFVPRMAGPTHAVQQATLRQPLSAHAPGCKRPIKR
jgi:hypothetical protein